MAIGAACRDSVWLQLLTTDVLTDMPCPILLCNNSSLVHVSTDNTANKRTRRAEHEFYYINKQLFKHRVALKWILASEQVADILTKPLGPVKQEAARRLMNVVYDDAVV